MGLPSSSLVRSYSKTARPKFRLLFTAAVFFHTGIVAIAAALALFAPGA